jgi:hypothetical protein
MNLRHDAMPNLYAHPDANNYDDDVERAFINSADH